MTKRIALGIASLLIAAAPSAFAGLEHLSTSQAGDGSVIVTLNGQVSYCDAALGGFIGSPSVMQSGNQITITSAIFAGECPPPPPGFVFPPPQPYEITVNAGHLPDGNYNVAWVFTLGGVPQQTFTSSFRIIGGGLIASIPALSRPMLIAMALLLALTGLVSLRA